MKRSLHREKQAMRQRDRRGRVERQRGGLLLIGISLFVAVLACGGKGPAPEGEAVRTTVSSIDVASEADKTYITVGGTEPILQYTSFQLTEPLRVIVDMTDVNLGEFQDRMVVNKGPVLDITPSQLDNVARLEIALEKQVETQVRQEGNTLVLDFGKPPAAKQEAAAAVQQEIPPAEAAPVVAPAEKPAATAPAPASMLTKVNAVSGTEGTRVVITGNGAIVPQISAGQDGRKVIIDIPNVQSRVRPSVIPVRKGGLDRVRIGQHKDKVRVVLDLAQPLAYTSSAEGETLILSLSAPGPQAEKAAAAPEKEAPKREIAGSVTAPLPQVAGAPEAAGPPSLDSVLETGIVTDAPRYTGRKISLDFQDADLVNVLRLFADVADLNIIIGSEVRGKVTVRLINVPWDQALSIILKMNSLGSAREENVLRIAPVAALVKEAEEEAKAKEAKKKAEDLITRIYPINYTTAKEIETTLKKSLSARGETVIDERTNTIIVKDISRNLDEISTLVKLLDKRTPQIMIEARIVQASANFTRDIGVQWGGTYSASAATGNPTGWVFPNTISVTGGPLSGVTPSASGNYVVNLPAAAGPGAGGALGITLGSLNKALNLDLVLSALESTGQGKIISNPRVSTLDNKEAKIEQGQSIPYSTTSAQGTQVQFIDAKLSLIVTPHATPDNKIFMKIKATKNAPDTSLLGAGGQPSIRKNEAETEILLSDGETAVIGGILEIDSGQTTQKVPFFADLPLIGWLFKKKASREEKRELIIFITPRIVNQEVV